MRKSARQTTLNTVMALVNTKPRIRAGSEKKVAPSEKGHSEKKVNVPCSPNPLWGVSKW